jgi:hypothetical protein
MPKFFDPVNHPKRSVNRVTINPNKVILDGGGSGTLDIYINGIKNTTIATYAGASYTTTATNWVTANAAFYLAKGFVVSNTSTGSASATIVVTPRHGWDTVNRINVTAPTIDTLSATFAGTFEPDLFVAKTWEVTLNCNTTVKYPRNAQEGDRIRLEFYDTSTYTVSWDTNGFFFVGGTEPTVTTTGYTTVEGVVNQGFYPRVDTITLSGSSGTASIIAGGLASKTITWGSNDTTVTAHGFTTGSAANTAAYLAVGIVLTHSGADIIFTAATRAANFLPIPRIATLTGDLAGTVVSVPEGRIQCNTVYLDIKQ